MRNLTLLLIAAVLLFGCTGGGQTGTNQSQGAPTQPSGTTTAPSGQGQACNPAFSFSQLQDGVLSQSATLVATVTCGAGDTLSVTLNGKPAASQTVASNDTQPVTFNFYPSTTGTLNLTVLNNGGVVYSKNWNVAALGNNDTTGLGYDSVSFDEYRAMAMDVQNQITAKDVRIYMKRIDQQITAGSQIEIQLTDNSGSGGTPGNVIDTVDTPINITTLTDNWETFTFPKSPVLSPGRYWIVVKEVQTPANVVSDVFTVHFVTIGQTNPGNNYTKEMALNVDTYGHVTQTQWNPLSYDRAYDIVLDGQ